MQFFGEPRMLRFSADGPEPMGKEQAEKRAASPEQQQEKQKIEAAPMDVAAKRKSEVEIAEKQLAQEAVKKETAQQLQELAKKLGLNLGLQQSRKKLEAMEKQDDATRKLIEEQRAKSEKFYTSIITNIRAERVQAVKIIQEWQRKRKTQSEQQVKAAVPESESAQKAAAEAVVKSINAIPIIRTFPPLTRPDRPTRPEPPEPPSGTAPTRQDFAEGPDGEREFTEARTEHEQAMKNFIDAQQDHKEALQRFAADELRFKVAMEVFNKAEGEFASEMKAVEDARQMAEKIITEMSGELTLLGEAGVAAAMREYRALFGTQDFRLMEIYARALSQMLPRYPVYWHQILEFIAGIEDPEELQPIVLLVQRLPADFAGQLCRLLDGRFLDRLYPTFPPALQKTVKEYVAGSADRSELQVRSILYRLPLQSPEQQRGTLTGLLRTAWERQLTAAFTADAERLMSDVQSGDAGRVAPARKMLSQLCAGSGQDPQALEQLLMRLEPGRTEANRSMLVSLMLRDRMRPQRSAAIALARVLRDIDSARPETLKQAIAAAAEPLAALNKAVAGSSEFADYVLVAALEGSGNMRERSLQMFAQDAGLMLESRGGTITLRQLSARTQMRLTPEEVLQYIMSQSNAAVRHAALDNLSALLPSTAVLGGMREQGLFLLQFMMARPLQGRGGGESNETIVKPVIEAFRAQDISDEARADLASGLAGHRAGIAVLSETLAPTNSQPLRLAAARGILAYWNGESTPFPGAEDSVPVTSATIPLLQMMLRDPSPEVRAIGVEVLIAALPAGTTRIQRNRVNSVDGGVDGGGEPQTLDPIFRPAQFRDVILALYQNSATTEDVRARLIAAFGPFGSASDAPMLLKRAADTALGIDNRLETLEALIGMEFRIIPSSEHRVLINIATQLAEIHAQLLKSGGRQADRRDRVRILIAEFMSHGQPPVSSKEGMESALQARKILLPVLRSFFNTPSQDDETNAALFRRFVNLPLSVLEPLIHDADPALAGRAIQLAMRNRDVERDERMSESLLNILQMRLKSVPSGEEELRSQVDSSIKTLRARLNFFQGRRKLAA